MSQQATTWSWDERRRLYYFKDTTSGRNVYWDARQSRYVLFPDSVPSAPVSGSSTPRSLPPLSSGPSADRSLPSRSGTDESTIPRPNTTTQLTSGSSPRAPTQPSESMYKVTSGISDLSVARINESDFQRREKGFFSIGRVFDVLSGEQTGDTVSQAGSTVTLTDNTITKVLRMVVLRDRETYCSALPITSYRSKGVAKTGVTKSEHGIIYTGRTEPRPTAAEQPSRGEQPMQATAVRVVPEFPDMKLSPTSRINYAKVYNVEHQSAAKPFGMVHKDSREAMEAHFRLVFLNKPEASSSVHRLTTQAASGQSRSGVSQDQNTGLRTQQSVLQLRDRQQGESSRRQDQTQPNAVRSWQGRPVSRYDEEEEEEEEDSDTESDDD